MNTLYVFEKQKLCHAQYLSELVKKALCCEGYQLCDTYKRLGQSRKEIRSL